MKRSILRALAADAYHQVVDNWVFRILTVLTLVPIAFTFLVGLRADSVVLLFGLKSWSYSELFGAFGVGALPVDPQGKVIGIVMNLCFDFLAGSLGILLALSATAFFVPRMLEKGTAELYFHKPVSRAWLLFSRYFAGLVFIAIVGVVLVLGMYLGLLLVSGYGEAGILVAAPQLVYTFALIHAFSVLCGVVTRSTVASILLSSFFFLFNGCVQRAWISWEQVSHGPSVRFERHEVEVGADGSASEPEEREHAAEPSKTVRALRSTLEVVHLVLPKTSDADYFAHKLRRALARPAFQDEDSLVTIYRLDSTLEALANPAADELAADAELRASLGELRFAASGPDGARYSLWRRPPEKSESRVGERVKVRVEASSQAAERLKDLLEHAGASGLTRETGHFGSDAGGDELSGSIVRGASAGGDALEARVFKGSDNEAWIYTLYVVAPGAHEGAAMDALVKRLLDQLGIDLTSMESWYPSQLGFTAPLRFNILFSVGSSLAFAAAMLLLSIWRLRRIEF